MEDELIVFTHNDLDALGSMLNIEYKMPNIRKKFFFTNYSNIPQVVDEIERHAQQFGNKHLLIPDVSFADNKPALTRLYNMFEKVTHIDHHLYPDGFWDDFPNMTVVYDKSVCATKLCQRFFKLEGENQKLDNLTYLVDVFDIWRRENPHFNTAQDLNKFFWTWGIEELFHEIVNNDYKLPKNYQAVVEAKHKYEDDKIKSYENRNLIHRAGNMTIAFVGECFDKIQLAEMENGKEFVIGINEWGIVKVRINENTHYTGTQLDDLREILTGNRTIGHMHAFTYKIQGTVNFEIIMKEVQKVTKAINDSCLGE